MTKAVIYLFLLNLLTGCSLLKEKTGANISESMTSEIKNSCPEKGVCTAERLKDKALVITESEQGKEVYLDIVDKKGSYVIHYKYEKLASGKYQDDFHTEEVYFQIDAETIKKDYKNADLQKVSMVFSRQCYCKGYAGNFRVTQGELEINHSTKETQVSLTFKAEGPQLIEELKFNVH